MDKRPSSRVNLDRAIMRLYGGDARYVEIRSIVANAVVGQFLTDGVVKGGSALRLRYGIQASRVTVDFDTARGGDVESFVASISEGLRNGWSGFSGEVVRRKAAAPKDVPEQYVMLPFDVKLKYMRQPWCTVRLEVGYDEIGDAREADEFISDEVRGIFRALCLEEPKPIPLMTLAHQVAQKLHGVSEPGSGRAHDLVDLQLIFARSSVDVREVRRIAERLFANRRRQPWPPKVEKGQGWDSLYSAAAGGLDVLPSCDEAVAWVNELVERIASAQTP